MRTFHIYGDYALTSQTELESFQSRNEAVRWAERYSRRDLGGYECIEVISFAADGEALVHWKKAAEID